MFMLSAILVGALIGWIASLVLRTDTSEGILIDIAAGALGAIPLAALLGNNSTFDSLIAGGLGATLALVVLWLVRRRLDPSWRRREPARPDCHRSLFVLQDGARWNASEACMKPCASFKDACPAPPRTKGPYRERGRGASGLLIAVVSLALGGCAYHRVVVPAPNPADQYYHRIDSTALGWGALEDQKVAEKCATNLLSEVRVRTSFWDSLVTVLTLGFVQPARAEYRCSKVPTGIGEIDP